MNISKKCFQVGVCAVGLAMMVTLRTSAQTPTQAQTRVEAAAPIKDYSRGFQALYKLGFPDVAKAEYVNLTLYGGSMSSLWFLHEVNLAGNAWMVEETPQVKGRFVVDIAILREVYDQMALSKERSKAMEAAQKSATNKSTVVVQRFMMGDEDGRTGGTWKKADPKKDVDKLIAYLKKGDATEGSSRLRQLQYMNGYGNLFLMAAHFHRKGLTNEANEVVACLFEAAGDPRKVVSEGVTVLASARLQEASRVFHNSGDWATYSKEIDALLQVFGASWQQAPAVKRLAEKIKQRIASPEPPALAGDGLTDEDRALAAELAAYRSQPESRFSLNSSELWVIPGASSSMGWRRPGVRPDVVSRIKQRGLKSVPMLLVLAKDDYMIALDHATLGGMSRFSFSSGGGEADVDRMYESLSRPATRGEIATSLLSSLLPRKERQRRSGRTSSSDDVYEECKAWYDANKAKTPVELARFYLQEGDSSQIQSAMRHLMKSGTPEDLQTIEKTILEAENLREMSYVARQYVEERGEQAKGFVEKYEARVTAAGAGGNDELFKNERSRKQMQQEIEALKALVKTQPFQDTLADVVSGVKPLSEVSGQLYRGLGKEKPEMALTVILEAALKAKDPAVSRDLLAMIPSLRHRIMGATVELDEGMDPTAPEAEGAEETGAAGGDKAADVTKHAALWRKLLEDKRPVAEEGGSKGMTVADMAASMMDALYSGEGAMFGMQTRDGRFSMGSKVFEVYRARAEAILAGKKGADLPQFPKMEALTDEQKTALGSRLAKLSGKALEAAVAALTPSEQVVLPGLVRKNPGLNTTLAPLANRVRKTGGAASLTNELKGLESIEGKVLDRAAVERLLALTRTAAGQGKVVRCHINRQAALEGVIVTVQEILPDSRDYKEMVANEQLGRLTVPEVVGQIAAPQCLGSATWLAGKETPRAAAPATAGTAVGDDEMLAAAVQEAEAALRADAARAETDFWKSVDSFCAGKGNVCRSGMILFEGRPAVKIAPAAKPGDEVGKQAVEAKP
jgi:hypothetical protein